MSKDTTDVIQVNFELGKLHFTMLHLSISTWRMFYYDSLSWRDSDFIKEVRMFKVCDELVRMARVELTGHGITIPSTDPHMSARVSRIDFQ